MRASLEQRCGPHVGLSHHSSHHDKDCRRFVCDAHRYQDHPSLAPALGRYGAAKFSVLPQLGFSSQTHTKDAQVILNDLLRHGWAESVVQPGEESSAV